MNLDYKKVLLKAVIHLTAQSYISLMGPGNMVGIIKANIKWHLISSAPIFLYFYACFLASDYGCYISGYYFYS